MDDETNSGGDWKWFRRGLLGLAAVITIIALFYAEENARGKHAWNKYRREQEAKGERFELKDFIPRPVPDEQNFAMIPFLKPVLQIDPVTHARLDPAGEKRAEDFGQNVYSTNAPGNKGVQWIGRKTKIKDEDWWQALTNSPSEKSPFASREEAARAMMANLEEYGPIMDQLRAASRLPYCRFNVNYETEPPAGILLPHLAFVKRMAQTFDYRARAELLLGRTEDALADLKMVFYLAGTMKDEPFLISGLVSCSMLTMGVQAIDWGLTNHQWSEAQLVEIENTLATVDLLKEYGSNLRGERALNLGNIESVRHHYVEILDENGQFMRFVAKYSPSGFYYRNELLTARLFEPLLTPVEGGVGHRVHASELGVAEARMFQELTSGFIGYRWLAKILMPAFGKAAQRFGRAQVHLDETQVVCALERYRLANGTYPASLDALARKFIKALPKDVLSGADYKYRLESNGQFVLYSVGWNEKDEGGVTVMNAVGKQIDINQGDWVWGEMP